jgi:hypothetical protein
MQGEYLMHKQEKKKKKQGDKVIIHDAVGVELKR